jgi:hypothetical protein
MTFRASKTVGQFTPSTPTMKESWDIQKAKLKKKYPELTESDLRYEEGKKGAMWENIKVKLGLSKEELQKLISRG